jgi:glycerophosphoryl diester phosphodiesterase
MWVISHRGLWSGRVPENTLEAFEHAAEVGVDGIETDVRRSRDGRLVLLHDRVTAGGKAVAELGHRELEAALGHPVATLEEALAAWPGLLWNIEIKSVDALPGVLSVLAGRKLPGGVLVTSFRHDVVAEVAERTALPCGLLVTHRPRTAAALLAGWERFPTLRTVVWDYDFHDPRILEETRSAGYESLVFGVKSEAEHRACLTLPLAGVITNEPELLLRLRGEARGGVSETASGPRSPRGGRDLG